MSERKFKYRLVKCSDEVPYKKEGMTSGDVKDFVNKFGSTSRGADPVDGTEEYQKLEEARAFFTRVNASLEKTRLAQNSNCSAEVLASLAADEDWEVRLGVARNPRCSAEVLASLAADEDWEVREGVAGNPRCSAEVLWDLAADIDHDVRLDAVQNPNYPKHDYDEPDRER